MGLFLLIFSKLLPLYLFMLMGYVAGRFLKIDPKQIGALVIYIIMPIVFFGGLWQSEISLKSLLIVIPIWMISFGVLGISYALGHFFYKNTNVKNLMASGFPTGNSGYFGIPVALAVFDSRLFAVFLIAAISNTIFQITLGYYMMALGKHNYKDSLLKLLKLPALYGALLGLMFSTLDISMPVFVTETTNFMKSAFTVLGMMIIGLTFAVIPNIRFDVKFVSLSVFVRFLIWPLLALLFIAADMYLLKEVYQPYYPIIALFSLLPIAADFAIYATQFNIFPARAAVVILMTTLLSALLIPLYFSVLS